MKKIKDWFKDKPKHEVLEVIGDRPIFPNFSVSSQGNTIALFSLVRKKFKGIWYLIPVRVDLKSETAWNSYTDAIKQHVSICYNTLLFYKDIDKVDERIAIYIDKNQLDEEDRIYPMFQCMACGRQYRIDNLPTITTGSIKTDGCCNPGSLIEIKKNYK
jgi:hypothetical protein